MGTPETNNYLKMKNTYGKLNMFRAALCPVADGWQLGAGWLPKCPG
jgi:hypothetical protein